MPSIRLACRILSRRLAVQPFFSSLLGEDNLITDSILKIESSNGNVLALQELVSSESTYVVRSGASIEVLQVDRPFYYQSEDDIRAEFKSLGAEPGEISGPSLFLGIFSPPGKDGVSQPTVTLSDGTGEAASAPRSERVVTAAHELYGHALLHSRSQPYRHGQEGVDSFIENVEQRTIEGLKNE